MTNTLNPQQEKALKEIKKWLKSKNQFHILSGQAGTGKTHLIKVIQEYCRQESIQNKITATTNKAVAVLAERVTDPCTIFSFLGLNVQDDWSTGRQKILPRPFKNGPPSYMLVVVDEASMASQQLLEYMVNRTVQCKFLLVGDIYQLPPVGANISPMMTLGAKVSLLTQIMRTRKPDLEKVYEEARNTVVNDKGIYVPPPSENVKYIKMAEVANIITPTTKLIGYTNAHVNLCNLSARNAFGLSLTPVEGDVLSLEDTYEENGKLLNYISEEVVVKGNKTVTKLIADEEIKCYEILTEDGRTFVMSFDASLRHQLMQHYSKAKRWPKFFAIKNKLADMRFTHAITGHKSQGSTYGDVIVMLSNMESCRNKSLLRRLLYVAYTRCTGTLYIVS